MLSVRAMSNMRPIRAMPEGLEDLLGSIGKTRASLSFPTPHFQATHRSAVAAGFSISQ